MSLDLYVKKWEKSPVFVKNIFMMVSRRSWLFVKNVISVVYAPLCHIPGASASLVPCPSFTGLSVSPACRYRQAETKSVPSTLAFAMRFFLCLARIKPGAIIEPAFSFVHIFFRDRILIGIFKFFPSSILYSESLPFRQAGSTRDSVWNKSSSRNS